MINMMNFIRIFKKYRWFDKFIFLIFICYNYSFTYAKEKELEQAYWTIDKYVENYEIMKKNSYDVEYLNHFRIKLDNNIIYINDNQYPITTGKVDNISKLIQKDTFDSAYLEEFILPNGEINYLQFDSLVDDNLAKLLLPKNRLIYNKDRLLLINEALAVSFLKPAGKYSFKKTSEHFPSLKLPLSSRISVNFIKDDNYQNYPQNLSRNFVHYLQLTNNDNLYSQLNNYITNISGIKLPAINKHIYPIMIDGRKENEEMITYLYLFSDKFDILDKITLEFSYGTTREDAETSHFPMGFIYFNIDQNYFIERRQRFEDETMEIQHFQVTNKGKFQELPTTSNCYREFAIKDKSQHSAQSLLLTSNQANNYLRFDGGRLDELDDVTLTFNPNEKTLCVNYQQAYSVTFGKANSKQFFDNDKLYQKHIANFKEHDIDISDELTYITIDNIKNSLLSKFLLHGNQAIYMNNTLFIVGEDYFVAYRQPTVNEVIYEEMTYNESNNED